MRTWTLSSQSSSPFTTQRSCLCCLTFVADSMWIARTPGAIPSDQLFANGRGGTKPREHEFRVVVGMRALIHSRNDRVLAEEVAVVLAAVLVVDIGGSV